MKKISIIVMMAAVMMLFTQCTGKKDEPKNDEAQVENQDKTADDEAVEGEEDAEGGAEMANIKLDFSGEKPTVKDVAIAMAQRFSVEVIGEEAELENPGVYFEALAKAVKEGKCAEGEELKIDEEKGTVWFKKTEDKEASVLVVKLDGDKVIVDFRNMFDGALNPAQFDGAEIYKVDVAKKELVFDSNSDESLVDDKGELK